MAIVVEKLENKSEIKMLADLDVVAFPQGDAYSAELLQKLYQRNREMFIVAKDDNKLIGFTIFVPLNEEGFQLLSIGKNNNGKEVRDLQDLDISVIMPTFKDSEYYYFSDIVLLPEYRKKGSVLLRFLSETAKKLNNKSQSIVTWPISDDGVKLAADLGFKTSKKGNPVKRELCYLDIPSSKFISKMRKRNER